MCIPIVCKSVDVSKLSWKMGSHLIRRWHGFFLSLLSSACHETFYFCFVFGSFVYFRAFLPLNCIMLVLYLYRTKTAEFKIRSNSNYSKTANSFLFLGAWALFFSILIYNNQNMRCLVFKFLFTSYEFLIIQSHCNYKMYIMANGAKPAIIFRILLKIFVSLSHQVKLLLRRFTEKSQKKQSENNYLEIINWQQRSCTKRSYSAQKRAFLSIFNVFQTSFLLFLE